MELTRISNEKAYRLFYPSVAAIIVAEYNGTVGGMPATSCMPSSLSPATVTVAIGTNHLTHDLVSQSERFTINFLHVDYSDRIMSLSKPAGKTPSKIESVGLVPGRTQLGLPYLIEASAYIESKVEKVVKNYDHDLFISKIIDAYASPDFREYWQFEDYMPAIYVGSGCKNYPTNFGKLIPMPADA